MPTSKELLAVGDFVRTDNQELGIGKLTALNDRTGRVTWFHSPATRIAAQHDVALSKVQRVELSNQHRVFFRDPDDDTWQVGRIADQGRIPGHHFGSTSDLYYIAFPNGRKDRVPIADLETRWDRPLDDPASILAARTTVTPFWHEGRANLMRSALAQRAACGGLTGLFSASVDLLAHQVRVVRAVLNDPVPRYLLADEVGLGKTIEALAILRQLVLEQPRNHATLIVTPPHLREQWEEEAAARFGFGPLIGNSIRFVGLDDLSLEEAPRILIVDEAHHAAGYAHSGEASDRQLYADLARVAHGSPGLLLLSATPVLRNEDGFLAMLHLLDPTAYPLSDHEAFRSRIARRREIADWLNDLSDDAPPLFMEDALSGIGEQLATDARALELVESAQKLVDADEGDLERREALASLRGHIGEVYRLHRRLLRTRRATLDEPLWGRGGSKVLGCEDSIRAEAERMLLHWQGELMLAVHRAGAPRETGLVLWGAFLGAALSHPRSLRELAAARINRTIPSPDLANCPIASLHAPFLFEGEEECLRELVDVLEGHRCARERELVEHVRARPAERFVVFVDRPAVALHLYGALEFLGNAARLHRDHDDVLDFTHSEQVRVLVCDVSAEEGLNLHRIPATIVHYDLPLAPNRIEQRLGRLDRIGAMRKVISVVFDDGAPISSAWLALLRDTVGVFDGSIASLQYVLDEHLRKFIATSFDEGMEAFNAFEEALRDKSGGLEAELDNIRRQENLDALEADPRERARFERMEDFDLDDERLQQELESWLVDRLQFQCQRSDALGWHRRYVFRSSGRATLIPVEHWHRWFNGVLAGATGASRLLPPKPNLTYRRRAAHLDLVPIARIGHPLFDGTLDHAAHDDRGVAFAMWRWRPESYNGPTILTFRFDFIVEADSRLGLRPGVDYADAGRDAAQRRLDELLPPRFVSVWLTEDLEQITDPDVLQTLAEPYQQRRPSDGRDWNLSAARWAPADKHHPVANWELLVERAASEASQYVCHDMALVEASGEARRDLAGIEAKVAAQLGARIGLLDGVAREAEKEHLESELALLARMDAALEHPHVRMDSAGAIFLSWDTPFDGDRR